VLIVDHTLRRGLAMQMKCVLDEALEKLPA